jgi:L-aminopeptidase/D-esterase-like protein
VLAAHATDEIGRTGATVCVFPAGARAGVWVPGSATGSRELGVLQPGALAGEVHAIVLAGGSAFGLSAADGVMGVLERRGIGFATPHGRVPIVPAAILFDLHTATRRPDAAMGAAAAEAASPAALAEGRVGAGTGARVGLASGTVAPGGFGGWAEDVGSGVVAAGVAVNAVGSVVDPSTGRVVAGGPPQVVDAGLWRGQTTLAVVVTDVPLDRERCVVVARMATAGMARTLFPAFTPFDGDVVFVASTGTGPPVGPEVVARVGDAAARCVAAAIVRAVR